MSKYDEKYEAAGEEASQSQVRGIIQQLNDEKPSHEKSREVVVRPDGTKVVRVTKKRRVLVSEADKRKAGRRSFMWMMLGAFTICFIGVAVLLFRMSQMSGEHFVQSRAEALKEAWGAESVQLIGNGVEGTEFHLSGLVADFPAGSLVEHVELSDISGELDTSTFFTQVLVADKVTVGRAEIRLNPDARTLSMPLFQGEELWKIRRIECDSMQVKMGDAAVVADAHSYLYHPRPDDRTACSLVLTGGTLQLKGMQLIRIRESKFLLSPRGVDEFSLSGTTDHVSDAAGAESTSLAFSGRIGVGASLAGPFEFDSDGMPLSDFTQGRFGHILTARTLQQAVGKEHSRARILLPLETEAPVFSGEFLLQQICLSGFPVQLMITQHMESLKRGPYQPPIIPRGRLRLQPDGGRLTVEFPEHQVEERDLMSLNGTLSLDAQNNISGKMNIGVPAILTHAEYADGKSDPVFTESAGLAWVTAELSGTVNVPADNSAMLHAQAEEARSSRPGRMNLEEVDFSKISKQIQRDRETLESVENATLPTSPSSTPEPQGEDNIFGKPGSLDMSSPLDNKGIFD